MLPSVEPNFSNKKEFDLASTMNTARAVGGDFYDFYMLDENHLAITIADVSGKGVGAALFMAISKTVIKNFAITASSAYSKNCKPELVSIIQQSNQQLQENNDEYMFVTVFFGILNLLTGEFAYVNAGHNPPLIRNKAQGEFSFIKNAKKNCALGINPKAKYQEHRLTLSHGDMLFLYTDGITEAMNEHKELFGEKRLETALAAIKDDNNASEIITIVQDNIRNFVDNAEQSDDMTMIGFIYK